MFEARRPVAAAVLLLVLLATPAPAGAQGLTPEPPGPYVIDVRGTTLGVPQTSDVYPDIPGGTVIPARGFGLQAGAHVYPASGRVWRAGFGVGALFTRATATTPLDSSETGDAAALPATFPDVAVTQQIISPQVSLNFGTSRGWSYLSAGVGRGRVRSTAGSDTLTTWRTAVNAGAGARWFVSEHFGVGFDLRAHWLGSRALFAASAGLSLK